MPRIILPVPVHQVVAADTYFALSKGTSFLRVDVDPRDNCYLLYSLCYILFDSDN